MPGFLKTLKKWIGNSYEFLGLVLVCSFVWFGMFLVGMAAITKVCLHMHPAVMFAVISGFYVLVLAPLAAGVYATAKKMITHDDPSPLDIFRGFKEFLVPGWLLGLSQVFITVLLAANAWFYVTRPNIVFKALGVLGIYAIILWVLSAIYHFPVLIEQRPSTLKILKRGFLLTLDNAAFTLGMFFAIILLTCFCAVTFLPLPLLWLGMVSILQTRALRALFVKYEMLPPEREYSPDDKNDSFKLPPEEESGQPVVEGAHSNG
jgi:uncharacterized membrane protein YesL